MPKRFYRPLILLLVSLSHSFLANKQQLPYQQRGGPKPTIRAISLAGNKGVNLPTLPPTTKLPDHFNQDSQPQKRCKRAQLAYSKKEPLSKPIYSWYNHAYGQLKKRCSQLRRYSKKGLKVIGVVLVGGLLFYANSLAAGASEKERKSASISFPSTSLPPFSPSLTYQQTLSETLCLLGERNLFFKSCCDPKLATLKKIGEMIQRLSLPSSYEAFHKEPIPRQQNYINTLAHELLKEAKKISFLANDEKKNRRRLQEELFWEENYRLIRLNQSIRINSYIPGNQDGPPLAVIMPNTPTEQFLVVWRSRGQNTTSSNTNALFYRIYTKGGNPLTGERVLYLNNSETTSNPQAITSFGGSVVVAWRMNTGPSSYQTALIRSINSTTGRVSSPAIKVYPFIDQDTQQAEVRLLGLDDHLLFVLYQTQAHIALIARNAAGETTMNRTFVSLSPGSASPDNQLYMSKMDNNTLAIMFRSQLVDGAVGFDVYLKLFDVATQTFSEAIPVSSYRDGTQHAAGILAANQQLLLLFRGVGPVDNNDIYGRLFNRTGSPLAEQFFINNYTTNTQTIVSGIPHSVVIPGTTLCWITWRSRDQYSSQNSLATASGFDIYGQIRAIDGTLVGPREFLVVPNITRIQVPGQPVVFPDGTLIFPYATQAFFDDTAYDVAMEIFRFTSDQTRFPSHSPTSLTTQPTQFPTQLPTSFTLTPTQLPSLIPTLIPSSQPTADPINAPTDTPTATPTDGPTQLPSDSPTAAPTDQPTTLNYQPIFWEENYRLIRLNESIRINSYIPGNQDGPPLAVIMPNTPIEQFLVVWKSRGQNTTSVNTNALFYRIYTKGGNPLTGERVLYLNNSETAGSPQAATAFGGSIVVAWRMNTGPSNYLTALIRSINSTTGRVSSPAIKVYPFIDQDTQQAEVRLLSLDDDLLFVLYQTQAHIALIARNAAGETTMNRTFVSLSPGAASPDNQLYMSKMDNNTLAIMFRSQLVDGAVGFDVYLKFFYVATQTFSEAIPVSSYRDGTQHAAGILTANQQLLLLFRGAGPVDNNDIYGRLFNRTGSPLAAQFFINNYTTNTQTVVSGIPHSAVIPGTTLCWIAWRSRDQYSSQNSLATASGFDIYGQIRAIDGTLVGPREFLVVPNMTRIQVPGQPAVFSDGTLVFPYATQAFFDDTAYDVAMEIFRFTSDQTQNPTLITAEPTKSPTALTAEPTRYPTQNPTTLTSVPSRFPTTPPTLPSDAPTNSPTQLPSNSPTTTPTNGPTNLPTNLPSDSPTTTPTNNPSEIPTSSPTDLPSNIPSDSPTELPTNGPTNTPTDGPSNNPSDSPTNNPTNLPSDSPTQLPTNGPTNTPTDGPSNSPSDSPTQQPTNGPTNNPTDGPSNSPSDSPTNSPTELPSDSPTAHPINAPTDTPTATPTDGPTELPSDSPTAAPTDQPTTLNYQPIFWEENYRLIRLNESIRINSYIPGNQDGPPLAVIMPNTPIEQFLVVWKSRGQNTTSVNTNALFYRIYTKGGNPLTGERVLYLNNSETAGSPQAATAFGGSIVVAWRMNTGPSNYLTALIRSINSTTGRVSSPAIKVYPFIDQDTQQSEVRLLSLDNDLLFVLYQTQAHIALIARNAAGETTMNRTFVSLSPGAASPDNQLYMSKMDNNTLAIMFRSQLVDGAVGFDVYLKFFYVATQTFSEAIPVSSYRDGTQHAAGILTANQQLLLLFRGAGPVDNNDIYGRLFNRTGSPLAAQFFINNYTTNTQTVVSGIPHSAVIPGTTLCWIAWRSRDQYSSQNNLATASGFDIYGQIRAIDGTLIGPQEFLVVPNMTRVQVPGQPAVFSDGTLVFPYATQAFYDDTAYDVAMEIFRFSNDQTQNPTLITAEPTKSPTALTASPTRYPTNSPTTLTSFPTRFPTNSPTLPSEAPTNSPTQQPTNGPTNAPSNSPSDSPTNSPTDLPSDSPTQLPTNGPTNSPSNSPTDLPSDSPTQLPTDGPTNTPTDGPSNSPSDSPTNSPTDPPSDSPTQLPTNGPTNSPTNTPTNGPSNSPSDAPTSSPTQLPTNGPTNSPTQLPSDSPTNTPSNSPSDSPTNNPTNLPSQAPTAASLTPTLRKVKKKAASSLSQEEVVGYSVGGSIGALVIIGGGVAAAIGYFYYKQKKLRETSQYFSETITEPPGEVELATEGEKSTV